MKHVIKLVIVAAGIISLFLLTQEDNHRLKTLSSENVEALANGEGGTIHCYGGGSIDCNGYNVEYIFGNLR